LIELAAGGMATVYLARATDRREGSPLVAVKRPHRHLAVDKQFISMLVDEARLASSIHHDNVVRVRELAFEGGTPFIVMDYVEGASLAELRRELTALGRTLDVRVALRIILDALAGLRAAHELKDENGRHLGIVHRDVSPHNVLIGCDGRSHITDFGIAKAEDRVQITRTHEVKGKLAYLAPERVDKRRLCTVQSDVFSMAVVLWECFAGRRLFRGEDAVDTLNEVLNANIPTLAQIGAQIPAALDDVIARALSRDLETRYASAAEFSEAIERAVGPEMIGDRTDVAHLMEAMFGPRMAMRHELVRETVGSRDLEKLLEESGLPRRERYSDLPERTSKALIASLAPPAPSGRYSFGQGIETAKVRRKPRKPWLMISAAASGTLAGVLLTIGFTARSGTPSSHANHAPRLVHSIPLPAPEPPPPVATPAPAPTVRKVVVPLPFLATRVTFDEVVRDLDPAADVAAFDVPLESGVRHRVTVHALDGTRAEAYVREDDGVARPEGRGYAVMQATARKGARPVYVPIPAASSTAPIGTVKNGFTKLK
jgi:serine/threonine-protein kinase